jgi:hypothetical protein
MLTHPLPASWKRRRACFAIAALRPGSFSSALPAPAPTVQAAVRNRTQRGQIGRPRRSLTARRKSSLLSRRKLPVLRKKLPVPRNQILCFADHSGGPRPPSGTVRVVPASPWRPLGAASVKPACGAKKLAKAECCTIFVLHLIGAQCQIRSAALSPFARARAQATTSGGFAHERKKSRPFAQTH